MVKITDPGELEIIKQVYGFEGRQPSEVPDSAERLEKKLKLLANQAR